ncbi:50S ribosomal protein L11 methyltransferase [Legionella longbeachae]|uniref:Ribosomal protein L11 methyltransferase n=1 Tax=Legionella longbeachae serogroup 1 (strain NSW150) TaxID=661367 RepID=D3HL37_LEGLN|nr:50S ribosomal protein L11 methyltransferase [Legionella longbeachae]VEE03663.1 ribosomal protein L11 methyltransferase [Legionella oakridgensis]HBD7397531.1 50S ribosomal protein L11 methyltransferase [Legionella pneumophila]ARB93454.1 50S ribosomal protein L11 methyltransferase [Legionella longbeachae]ARM33442.1 50S ribosomal protein L11 methyltransferase [Legionella longbeachae]EEZ93710.1 ribosomal protein L11 methyltransferase [Legionella longbeachae D-4968]
MWFQLKVEHCPSQEIEQLSDQLENFGALSIMLTDKNDNPVLEPEPGTTPLWPEVIIHALFAEAFQAQYTRDQLIQTYPALACTLEVLEDRDWERAWMDDFKPQRYGQRLWICPTWSTPPEPNAVNLMLDPGLAFGTGTHPTTALCLTWLEQANLSNKSIIDYGCGSGILSLAALKLGAKEVYAVDIDPQALQATNNNALTNQLGEHQLLVSLPDALQHPVDLIIANILLAPLLTLKERFHRLLKNEGILIVSGILEEQTSEIIKTYDSMFALLHQEKLNGWSLLAFVRK